MERIPRNVKVLSAVSFFQDAASELVYPVLPLFLTQTLGAPASVVGLIEGVAEGTAAVGKAVSGRLADRFKRRPLIAAGYGLSSAAKPLIALATGWPLVLAARFFDRVGKGVRTSPRDALIAADTPPSIRGRAYGMHRAADSAGAVVGPLLGLVLYEALDHRLRPLFVVAAIPAFISVALIAFVREHAPPPAAAHAEKRPSIALSELPRRYWRVVAFLAVFGLLNFSDALIILRASDLGLGFVGIVVVYSLYNLVYAGLSLPAGIVSDRRSRASVFIVGLVPFAIAYIGLGLASSPGWVWALLPIYGAFTALTDGVARAWVADLLPERALGTGIGVFQGITGATALVASVWAGLAWGSDGHVPLLISGLGVAALIPIVWVMSVRSRTV